MFLKREFLALPKRHTFVDMKSKALIVFYNCIMLGCLIVFTCTLLQAQSNPYPQNYFRNPLDIPILLAGDFGECRPNHFHTGIDIKTNGKENQPVHAAADGYVYRISVSHLGYGNCIYLKHPNGYLTVYGHLNDFYPALMNYVKLQQYAKESWALDIEIPEGKFPVKKGDVIAYSGNTGGSTAPHLHFEVRDAKTEHVLNAGLFGLPIKDNTPPVPKSVAVYTGGSVYIQTSQIFSVKKMGNGYTLSQPLVTTESYKIRIGVLADDYMPGSTNTLGVYAMELYLDDALQASWQLNDLDFDYSRDVNAFADFRLKEQKGIWYEGLYRLSGNGLKVYTHLNDDNGALDIGDGKVHTVKVVLKDFSGNASQINFDVQYKQGDPGMVSCDMLSSQQPKMLSNKYFKFQASANSLYDNVCANYSVDTTTNSLSAVLQLLSTEIPLRDNCNLSMRLLHPVSFALRSKLAFVHHVRAASLPGNNPQSGMAATYEDGWASAQINTFGNFYVVVDATAPVITCVIKNGTDLSKAKSISFTVKEKITSADNVRPELNGKWLRFVRRGDTYTYIFDEHCSRGKNSLTIKATDENGNEATKSISFIR